MTLSDGLPGASCLPENIRSSRQACLSVHLTQVPSPAPNRAGHPVRAVDGSSKAMEVAVDGSSVTM